MTTALLADDEPHLALYLKDQLKKLWPDLDVVHIARNGIEAAEKIAALEPDLAFLDIQMPGLTGLQVAQGIEGTTRVVFVTAYDEFAVQAFDHAALDYLLKPLKTDRLQLALDRVKATLASGSTIASPEAEAAMAQALQRLLGATTSATPRLHYVRAAQGDLTQQIAVEDVLFFQADDKYTVVQTERGEHLLRTPIVDLAAQLDPDQFWQVHRSTLVNLRYLSGTRRDENSRLFLRIKGYTRELPVSRAYVHLFKAM
jgi:DNA-binding LytR/AlgR family response regulator